VVSRRTLYWRWQRNSPLDIHHGQAHWGAAPCSVLARTGFEWRSQRDRRLQAVEWYRVRIPLDCLKLKRSLESVAVFLSRLSGHQVVNPGDDPPLSR
jgi:hypothetical protein